MASVVVGNMTILFVDLVMVDFKNVVVLDLVEFECAISSYNQSVWVNGAE
jgi:hypothetical protein